MYLIHNYTHDTTFDFGFQSFNVYIMTVLVIVRFFSYFSCSNYRYRPEEALNYFYLRNNDGDIKKNGGFLKRMLPPYK